MNIILRIQSLICTLVLIVFLILGFFHMLVLSLFTFILYIAVCLVVDILFLISFIMLLKTVFKDGGI